MKTGRIDIHKQRRYWMSSSVAPYCLLWNLFGWREIRFAFLLRESAWATVGKDFEPGRQLSRPSDLRNCVIKVPSVVTLTLHSSEFEVFFFVSCGSTVGLPLVPCACAGEAFVDWFQTGLSSLLSRSHLCKYMIGLERETPLLGFPNRDSKMRLP